MKLSFRLGLTSLALALGCAAAQAQQKWGPVKVIDQSSGKDVIVDYTPLDKASKPWKLCVLFPHMKDSLWVAVAYGIVEEAKRQGVRMTLLQAGGYDSLPKQLSQYDDCVAGKADAIIVGAISEAGMIGKLKEGAQKGIVQVAVVNPVPNAPIEAKVSVDYVTMGGYAAKHLVAAQAGKPANVVAFPGPQGSGWAEAFLKGFKDSLAGTPVKLLDTKFGDTGVAIQQRLVEDALQAYSGIDWIWGTPPTAEAAIGVLAEAGLSKKVRIIAENENQAMLDGVRKGTVDSFVTLWPVLEARMAVDQAIRALEKKPTLKSSMVIPVTVTSKNLESLDLSLIFAPTTWRPVYSVN